MSCNMCTMCGGSTMTPNYQKQVDPHTQHYGTILGDAPQRTERGLNRGNIATLQVFAGASSQCPGRHNPGQQPSIVHVPRDSARVCQPYLGAPTPCPGRHNPGQQPCVVNIPRDCVKECPKIVCEPCPPPPPTKVWLIKSSPMPQKSFAIAQPPPCIPICNQPIFIPCQRPC